MTIHRCVKTLVFLTVLAGGCGTLDVSDPTAIEESDIANRTGADLLRKDAVAKLYHAISWATAETGTLADELHFPTLLDLLDARRSIQYEESGASVNGYTLWQDVRKAAILALSPLRAYGVQPAVRAHIGEMFAVRGLAEVALAEGYCAGFPLHDVVNFNPVYGLPLSTDQVFQRALANLDSAVAYAADSTRVLYFARVVRARALLGLGQFTEAATGLAPVPTSYSWNARYSASSFAPADINRLGFDAEPNTGKARSVANLEGGNGLAYITANDPRVRTTKMTRGSDTAYVLAKYPNRGAPIVVASGVEARLIEAESKLRAGDPGWLATLNTLRTSGTQTAGMWDPGTGGIAGLGPLSDPGTADTRVDLLFRERAFWLFGTGHRLGDLRRLIGHYSRGIERVFPTGSYSFGPYGTATSIPFPSALERPYSPTVSGCTSR